VHDATEFWIAFEDFSKTLNGGRDIGDGESLTEESFGEREIFSI
jgi:hypothetical protein